MYLMIKFGVGGEGSQTLLSNMLVDIPITIAGLVTLWSASQFPPGESLRRQWSWIAAAAVVYLLAEAAWTYYEVIKGIEVPFPGVPDIFYSLMIPVMFVGLMMAVMSFRRVFNPWPAYLASLALGVGFAVALCATVLLPSLTDTSSTLFSRLLGAFYPVGDLVLLLPPALALTYLTARLGSGTLAWPWRAVVVGLLMIVFADTMFAIQSVTETYVTGTLVDMGWAMGFVFIGFGSSIAVDVQLTAPQRAAARLLAAEGNAQ